MTHKTTVALVFVLLLLLVVFADDVPRIMNYQAKLTNSDGVALNGDYSITFRIYDDPTETEGHLLWYQTKTVTVTNGLFDEQLDLSINGGDTLKFDRPYWIALEVESDGEMTPREKLAPVGYAFRSIYADTADYVEGGAGGSSNDWKVAISTLENSITDLELLQANSIPDISHTYMQRDVFTDNDGYNNTIDVANTTADFADNGFIGADCYDDFEDGTVGSIWTTSIGSDGSVSESDGAITVQEIMYCGHNATGTTTCESNNLPGLSELNTLTFKLNKYIRGAYASGGVWSYYQRVRIYFGGQIIESHQFHDEGGVRLDETCEYVLVKSGSDYDVYKDGIYLRTITPTSNVLEFYTYVSSSFDWGACGSFSEARIKCWYVYYNNSDRVVQTTTKTFGSNIEKVLVTAGYEIPSGTSITVDVSTNGGTSWDALAQPLNQIITCSGTDSDLVLRFHLNVSADGKATPRLLHGYAVQVW